MRLMQRVAIVLVPPIAAGLIRLIGMTLRYEDRTDPGVTPGDQLPDRASSASGIARC